MYLKVMFLHYFYHPQLDVHPPENINYFNQNYISARIIYFHCKIMLMVRKWIKKLDRKGNLISLIYNLPGIWLEDICDDHSMTFHIRKLLNLPFLLLLNYFLLLNFLQPEKYLQLSLSKLQFFYFQYYERLCDRSVSISSAPLISVIEKNYS